MGKAEYKDGTDLLYGRVKFTVNTGSVEGQAASGGKHSFSGCIVESVPQPKNRKPHMIVKSGKGEILFEVGARQTGAYSALKGLEGQELAFFSWNEQNSYLAGGTFLLCKATAAKREAIVDDPIPRIILDSETTGLHPALDGFSNWPSSTATAPYC